MMNNIYNRLINKEAKLAVVGLGYVGLPLAYEFSKYMDVIGFDINEKRIEACKSGIDVTNEVGKKLETADIAFTADEAKLREASFVIVSVPTPVDAEKHPDLKPVIRASEIVGRNLAYGAIVVYESTVYPGVTEEVCLPVIEKCSGMKCGIDFRIGYSPERVNPGDRVHTLSSIQKVVSGMDEQTVCEIAEVYGTVVQAGIYRSGSIRTAEAIKVIENAQRDVNIAFMNEIAMICGCMGIDTAEVLSGMNTKWNALGFHPGLVGGHCLDVDPYYLIEAAKKHGCQSTIMTQSRKLNDSMGVYIADKTAEKLLASGKSLSAATVVILGITFKENCPDIRNSKIIDVYRALSQKNIRLFICDPWADKAQVKESYGIELTAFRHLPKADCVIVAVGHQEYRSLSLNELIKLYKEGLTSSEKILIDVKSLFDLTALKAAGITYYRL